MTCSRRKTAEGTFSLALSSALMALKISPFGTRACLSAAVFSSAAADPMAVSGSSAAAPATACSSVVLVLSERSCASVHKVLGPYASSSISEDANAASPHKHGVGQRWSRRYTFCCCCCCRHAEPPPSTREWPLLDAPHRMPSPAWSWAAI